MTVYFTGTGNSRYCAEALAARLGDELVDSSHFIKNGIAAELITSKPWVFVCPTYAWRMPRVFADFIRSGSFSGSADAYFVLTCGGDAGDAQSGIRELCEEKGLRCRGTLEVVMPENYVAMFAVPSVTDSIRIIREAHPVIDGAAERIRAGEDFPEKRISAADRKKSGPVNRGFYKFYVNAKAFYATDKCSGCGRCAEGCVLNNIELKDGKPVWGGSCTHCMACICRCPSEAIEYGKRSAGKRRYRCPEYAEEA